MTELRNDEIEKAAIYYLTGSIEKEISHFAVASGLSYSALAGGVARALGRATLRDVVRFDGEVSKVRSAPTKRTKIHKSKVAVALSPRRSVHRKQRAVIACECGRMLKKNGVVPHQKVCAPHQNAVHAHENRSDNVL